MASRRRSSLSTAGEDAAGDDGAEQGGLASMTFPKYYTAVIGRPRQDIPRKVLHDPDARHTVFETKGKVTTVNRVGRDTVLPVSSYDYNSLHDPHVRKYYMEHPKARKHLIDAGLLSEDGRVLGNSRDLRQGAKAFRLMAEREEMRRKVEERERRRQERLRQTKSDPKPVKLPKLLSWSVERAKQREELAERRKRLIEQKTKRQAMEEKARERAARLERQRLIEEQEREEAMEKMLARRERYLREQLREMAQTQRQQHHRSLPQDGIDAEAQRQRLWERQASLIEDKLEALRKTKWRQQVEERQRREEQEARARQETERRQQEAERRRKQREAQLRRQQRQAREEERKRARQIKEEQERRRLQEESAEKKRQRDQLAKAAAERRRQGKSKSPTEDERRAEADERLKRFQEDFAKTYGEDDAEQPAASPDDQDDEQVLLPEEIMKRMSTEQLREAVCSAWAVSSEDHVASLAPYVNVSTFLGDIFMYYCRRMDIARSGTIDTNTMYLLLTSPVIGLELSEQHASAVLASVDQDGRVYYVDALPGLLDVVISSFIDLVRPASQASIQQANGGPAGASEEEAADNSSSITNVELSAGADEAGSAAPDRKTEEEAMDAESKLSSTSHKDDWRRIYVPFLGHSLYLCLECGAAQFTTPPTCEDADFGSDPSPLQFEGSLLVTRALLTMLNAHGMQSDVAHASALAVVLQSHDLGLGLTADIADAIVQQSGLVQEDGYVSVEAFVEAFPSLVFAVYAAASDQLAGNDDDDNEDADGDAALADSDDVPQHEQPPAAWCLLCDPEIGPFYFDKQSGLTSLTRPLDYMPNLQKAYSFEDAVGSLFSQLEFDDYGRVDREAFWGTLSAYLGVPEEELAYTAQLFGGIEAMQGAVEQDAFVSVSTFLAFAFPLLQAAAGIASMEREEDPSNPAWGWVDLSEMAGSPLFFHAASGTLWTRSPADHESDTQLPVELPDSITSWAIQDYMDLPSRPPTPAGHDGSTAAAMDEDEVQNKHSDVEDDQETDRDGEQEHAGGSSPNDHAASDDKIDSDGTHDQDTPADTGSIQAEDTTFMVEKEDSVDASGHAEQDGGREEIDEQGHDQEVEPTEVEAADSQVSHEEEEQLNDDAEEQASVAEDQIDVETEAEDGAAAETTPQKDADEVDEAESISALRQEIAEVSEDHAQQADEQTAAEEEALLEPKGVEGDTEAQKAYATLTSAFSTFVSVFSSYPLDHLAPKDDEDAEQKTKHVETFSSATDNGPIEDATNVASAPESSSSEEAHESNEALVPPSLTDAYDAETDAEPTADHADAPSELPDLHELVGQFPSLISHVAALTSHESGEAKDDPQPDDDTDQPAAAGPLLLCDLVSTYPSLLSHVAGFSEPISAETDLVVSDTGSQGLETAEVEVADGVENREPDAGDSLDYQILLILPPPRPFPDPEVKMIVASEGSDGQDDVVAQHTEGDVTTPTADQEEEAHGDLNDVIHARLLLFVSKNAHVNDTSLQNELVCQLELSPSESVDVQLRASPEDATDALDAYICMVDIGVPESRVSGITHKLEVLAALPDRRRALQAAAEGDDDGESIQSDPEKQSTVPSEETTPDVTPDDQCTEDLDLTNTHEPGQQPEDDKKDDDDGHSHKEREAEMHFDLDFDAVVAADGGAAFKQELIAQLAAAGVDLQADDIALRPGSIIATVRLSPDALKKIQEHNVTVMGASARVILPEEETEKEEHLTQPSDVDSSTKTDVAAETDLEDRPREAIASSDDMNEHTEEAQPLGEMSSEGEPAVADEPDADEPADTADAAEPTETNVDGQVGAPSPSDDQGTDDSADEQGEVPVGDQDVVGDEPTSPSADDESMPAAASEEDQRNPQGENGDDQKDTPQLAAEPDDTRQQPQDDVAEGEMEGEDEEVSEEKSEKAEGHSNEEADQDNVESATAAEPIADEQEDEQQAGEHTGAAEDSHEDKPQHTESGASEETEALVTEEHEPRASADQDQGETGQEDSDDQAQDKTQPIIAGSTEGLGPNAATDDSEDSPNDPVVTPSEHVNEHNDASDTTADEDSEAEAAVVAMASAEAVASSEVADDGQEHADEADDRTTPEHQDGEAAAGTALQHDDKRDETAAAAEDSGAAGTAEATEQPPVADAEASQGEEDKTASIAAASDGDSKDPEPLGEGHPTGSGPAGNVDASEQTTNEQAVVGQDEAQTETEPSVEAADEASEGIAAVAVDADTEEGSDSAADAETAANPEQHEKGEKGEEGEAAQFDGTTNDDVSSNCDESEDASSVIAAPLAAAHDDAVPSTSADDLEEPRDFPDHSVREPAISAEGIPMRLPTPPQGKMRRRRSLLGRLSRRKAQTESRKAPAEKATSEALQTHEGQSTAPLPVILDDKVLVQDPNASSKEISRLKKENPGKQVLRRNARGSWTRL